MYKDKTIYKMIALKIKIESHTEKIFEPLKKFLHPDHIKIFIKFFSNLFKPPAFLKSTFPMKIEAYRIER